MDIIGKKANVDIENISSIGIFMGCLVTVITWVIFLNIILNTINR